MLDSPQFADMTYYVKNTVFTLLLDIGLYIQHSAKMIYCFFKKDLFSELQLGEFK